MKRMYSDKLVNTSKVLYLCTVVSVFFQCITALVILAFLFLQLLDALQQPLALPLQFLQIFFIVGPCDTNQAEGVIQDRFSGGASGTGCDGASVKVEAYFTLWMFASFTMT